MGGLDIPMRELVPKTWAKIPRASPTSVEAMELFSLCSMHLVGSRDENPSVQLGPGKMVLLRPEIDGIGIGESRQVRV